MDKNSQSPIKKIKAFFDSHEDLRQLVMFTLFSFVCFLIEYVVYLILHFSVASAGESFHWFIFHYESGGAGEFAAFLVSNIVAQAATFILNRKKTFNADNNIVFAGIAYAIMVAGIIVLNTWIGGVIRDALVGKINGDFAGIIGKLVGSFLSFVISFLMSKFVIMRKKKRPTENTESAENVADDKNAETETVVPDAEEN